MSYKESRRPFVKLFRKEPAVRQAGLSYHARPLALLLLRHADDSGCLGPKSERGHAAATLGQMLAVPARNRKAFHREIEELLAYGDDDEPLALVIRDGHFFLTRFEACQANRRDKRGTEQGQNADKTRTEHGPSLPPEPAEPLESETELGAEVRREKKEIQLALQRMGKGA